MRRILFVIILIFVSLNLFAKDDLTLVCKGIEEFYTVPLDSDSIFKNKTKTYIFENSHLKTELIPVPGIDCKFEENFINCGLNRAFRDDGRYMRSIRIDRNSGKISDSMDFPFEVLGAKFAHTSFEGMCKVGKKQF